MFDKRHASVLFYLVHDSLILIINTLTTLHYGGGLATENLAGGQGCLMRRHFRVSELVGVLCSFVFLLFFLPPRPLSVLLS